MGAARKHGHISMSMSVLKWFAAGVDNRRACSQSCSSHCELASLHLIITVDQVNHQMSLSFLGYLTLTFLCCCSCLNAKELLHYMTVR